LKRALALIIVFLLIFSFFASISQAGTKTEYQQKSPLSATEEAVIYTILMQYKLANIGENLASDVTVETYLFDDLKGWANQEILNEQVKIDGNPIFPPVTRTPDYRTSKISVGDLLPGETKTITITQTVKVRSVYFDVKPEDVGTAFPPEVEKYTLPIKDLFESDSNEIKEFAKEIVGKETNPYIKAKLILEKVMEYLTWEWQIEEHSALWAYRSRKGDCTEHANLLIALMRAAGIPAKAVVGYGFIPLYTGRASMVEGGLDLEPLGHAWAIIYLPNIGWVPVDAVWPEKIGSFAEADYRHIVGAVTGGEGVVQDGSIIWPGPGSFSLSWYGPTTLEGSFSGAIIPEVFIEPELKMLSQTDGGLSLALTIRNIGRQSVSNLNASIVIDPTYFEIIPAFHHINNLPVGSQVEENFEVIAKKTVYGEQVFIPRVVFNSAYGTFQAKGIPLILLVKIEVEISAEITNIDVFGKFKAGEKVPVTVTIKNIGNTKSTFYVNGSLIDSVGKLYSNDFPAKEVILEAGAEGKVTLEWVVDMSTPAGEYDARVAVWKGRTGDKLVERLDIKEKVKAFEVVPDGFDYDALEWINVIEARELIPRDEDMSEVIIAIIDSYLDPDIWEYIESKGGNIALYVRPSQYFDWWSLQWKWKYEVADNPNLIPFVPLGISHGSQVTSVAWQVAPKAKLMFFDISPEIFGPASIEERVEKSLQWIIDHMNEYDVDIISMSLGTNKSQEWEIIRDEINELHNRFGVFIIASGGNRDVREYIYPASFDEVVSIGGIFDDEDGFLTYAISKRFNYPGYRITESIYMEFTEHPYEPRKSPLHKPPGSTYNDKIDFVAPYFDVEVLTFYRRGNQEGIGDVYVGWSDGTSFSAPMVAGVAALTFHAYYKLFKLEPKPITIYEALKQTAEIDPTTPNVVPKPQINGKTYDVVQRNDYVGWGCIDAYDAIVFIMKGEK
jgi:hypothetical protein